MRISLDLGSNTLRAGIFKYENKNLQIIKNMEFVVGSARGATDNLIITNDSKKLIFSSIENLKQEMDFDKYQYNAFATGIFRKAKNSNEIINEIYDRFGVKIEIISGQVEAKLVFLAMQNQLKKLNISDFAFIDLGGFSTEIGDENYKQSFDFGSISCLENLNKEILNLIDKANLFLENLNKKHIALCSGVPTSLAFLSLRNKEQINGFRLNLKNGDEITNYLKSMKKEDSDTLLGKDRAQLILRGWEVLKIILKNQKRDFIVIDDGLREGIAIAAFENQLTEILYCN